MTLLLRFDESLFRKRQSVIAIGCSSNALKA
jgi:hypothetical protein